MTTRERLVALLEIYDEAVEELYVRGDSVLLDLILRLERRRIEAASLLGSLDRRVGGNAWQTGLDRSRSAAA